MQGGGLGTPERKEKQRASAQTLAAHPYSDTVPPSTRKVGAPWLRDHSVQRNEVSKATWISKARGKGSGGSSGCSRLRSALSTGDLFQSETGHLEKSWGGRRLQLTEDE